MENQLARAVDALPGLVWTALRDGTVDFVNSRWSEYTGLSAEDAYGTGWQTVIHPDDLPDVLERWQSILASGELREIEARLRRSDGEYRWFLLRASPMTNAGEPAGKWCCVNIDIEDYRRGAETARAAESRFRSIVDELPALVALMGPAGEFAYANRRLMEYCGATREDMSAWATSGVIHPDDLPVMRDRWMQSVATGSPYDIEHRVRRHDGTYRWFDVHGAPLRDAEGRIVLWHIALADIDDRKRAETQLAGEKRLLEMIASGRSLHDVLHALCTFVEDAATGCYCGAYVIDWTGPIFRVGAVPSLPPSFSDPIEGMPVRPDAVPCAAAACSKTQVISTDLSTDPLWRDSAFGGLASAHGLRSVWTTPIYSLAGSVLGTLALYQRRPASPTARQLDLIAQVTHIASIAIERSQSEAALRRSEAFLAQAQRLTLTGTLWWKTSTGEITWSEESYRLMEYPVTVAPAVDLMLKRCHPDDLPLVQATLGRAIRDGTSFDFEHRLLMPNGSIKHVHVVVQNVGLAGGPPEFLGAVTDITERKLAEDRLRRSEAYLAEAQKLSHTGSFGWNVPDDRHYWSAETFRIFEYDPSTTVTIRVILQRVHPQDLDSVRRLVAQAADGHDFDYECRLLMPHGAVKHIHIVAHGSRDRHGRVEYLGAVQDVTAQRLSEEALGRVRSELARVARVMSLGALTASIAHEVNQPLSGIITNASTCLRMLAAEPPNVDGALETARRTLRDGNRASDVITRLRALFTRHDATTESVDLNEATREVVALSRAELRQGRVMLRLELDDHLPVVMGDRVQLQQVILNLLRNASDAMTTIDDRPRELVIRTEPDGADRVRLSVQDTGIGLEPHSVDKLFDAFYTTKPGGMGIGLSVSRSIIDRHQGHLWAAPNDGPGTTFAFSLPSARLAATRTHGGAVARSHPATEAPHVMGTH